MLVFWNDLIKPIFEMLNVKKVIEVGSQNGHNTRNLATYCQKNGGVLYSIDPFPMFDINEFKNDYLGSIEIIQELSLSALPKIYEYDAILIDGDHNWYTVFNELKIIEKNFKDKLNYPVIFLHDIGWPYGRRDLYYNPENIPLAYRQPYKKWGLSIETSSLVEEGFNNHLHNAIYENNPNNGVLTAVEDYLNITERELELIDIYGFNGLGIILQKDSAELVRSFVHSKKDYLIANLEIDRLREIIKKQALSKQLSITKKHLNNIEKEFEANKNELKRLILEKKSIEKEFEANKNELKKSILEKKTFESSLQEYKYKIIELNKQISLSGKKDELHAIKNQLDKTQFRFAQAEQAAYIHRNSIRYRLGDIIISALKPSRNTLLFPISLVKLLAEGLRKKKQKKLL